MPWMNNHILQLIKNRETFYRQKIKDPHNAYVNNHYKYYCSETKKEIKRAKKLYYSNVFEPSISNPKKLWKNLKFCIFNRSDCKKNELKINYNNCLHTDNKEIANIFNEYFVNKVDSRNGSINPTSVNGNIQLQIAHKFELKYTNDFEVRAIIASLKQNAATGIDKISAKLLQKCSHIISQHVSVLVNRVFETCIFPQSLKTSIVTPVPKSGNSTDLANYRPISVLPSLSKITEIILLSRLDEFLEKNSVISLQQFGFCKNSNTSAACVELTNVISKAIDKRKYTSCIFLDLRCAFDSVNFSILLKKLEKLQFTSNQLQLFHSYLHGRTQIVSVGKEISESEEVKTGVPQGSILGPTLFRIYINDITQLDLEGHIILYADDAVIVYDDKELQSLYDKMNKDMRAIKSWLSINLLELNVEKTKYLVFKNRALDGNDNLLVKYEHKNIDRIETFTYLGLKIESSFKWDAHIDKVKLKIVPYIFAIKKSKNILPQKILGMIYNSYILSHFVYLNPIWSSCSKQKLNELYILQKRAIKYIYHVPVRFPTSMLFEGSFQSLLTICKRELLILAHKIVHKKIKHNFQLTYVGNTHNYNTRRVSLHRVDQFATNARDNNVLYRGISEFNKLPRNIRHEKSLKMFKRSIAEYVESGGG